MTLSRSRNCQPNFSTTGSSARAGVSSVWSRTLSSRMPSDPPVHRAEHLNVADWVEPELGRNARFDHVNQHVGNLLRLRPVDEKEIGLGILGRKLRHVA